MVTTHLYNRLDTKIIFIKKTEGRGACFFYIKKTRYIIFCRYESQIQMRISNLILPGLPRVYNWNIEFYANVWFLLITDEFTWNKFAVKNI